MYAYAHTFKATLDERGYLVTLHIVALGDYRYCETLSVADAGTHRTLDVCGHMDGEAWGREGLPEVIGRAVATAHERNRYPYVANEGRVASLARSVEYEEVEPFASAYGNVSE